LKRSFQSYAPATESFHTWTNSYATAVHETSSCPFDTPLTWKWRFLHLWTISAQDVSTSIYSHSVDKTKTIFSSRSNCIDDHNKWRWFGWWVRWWGI